MDIGPKSNNAAELHALVHALDHLLKQNFPAFIKNIRIFIDNQYAIKTTVKEWVAKSNLDLIHQAQTLLCRLKQRFPTHLLWVPGHAQIPGNEIADWLAKRGAQGNSTCDPPPENILHPRPPARPRPVAPPPISADHELADDIPPSDDEEDGPVRPPTS
jgi:ribonuclease HI